MWLSVGVCCEPYRKLLFRHEAQPGMPTEQRLLALLGPQVGHHKAPELLGKPGRGGGSSGRHFGSEVILVHFGSEVMSVKNAPSTPIVRTGKQRKQTTDSGKKEKKSTAAKHLPGQV